MDNHLRQSLYFTTAFVAGIIATVGIQEILRFWRSSTSDAHSEIDYSQYAADGITLRDSSLTGDEQPYTPRIVQGIEGCIGNTPLLRIKSLSDVTKCEILAKAEVIMVPSPPPETCLANNSDLEQFLNGAGGSPKDRVALGIINAAEAEGLLTPHSGDTIYEGTVGSTGISLATLCRARGYRAYICMPSDQSAEKSDLLLKLGATVDHVLPAPITSPNQFVNLARRLATQHTNSPIRPGRGFFADQFENPANYLTHYHTTGPEIHRQTNGSLSAFICGAGTGGTISGVSMFLKPRVPGLRVVLADPQGSGLFNKVRFGVMFGEKEKEGTRRRHQVDSIVEGIGINRVTANFEAGRELVDDAVRVSDEQAMAMARWLVEKDGIFVGSSSAVNCVAAVQTALSLGPGHTVVTILSDSGARHLSKFWAQAGDIDPDSNMTLEDILNAGNNGSNSL